MPRRDYGKNRIHGTQKTKTNLNFKVEYMILIFVTKPIALLPPIPEHNTFSA
jgi:hypothetical protein